MIAAAELSTSANDPVCGMSVDPATAKHRAEHGGRDLLFLLGRCREKFVAEPARYLGARAGPPRRSPRPRARSTPARCIRKSGRRARAMPDLRHGARAGNVTADDGPQRRTDRHDAALLDRLGARGPGGRARNGRPSRRICICGFARTSRTGFSSRWRRRSCCGRAGRSSSAAGRRSVSRNLNMFTLIAMGTGVAWAYSVVATVAPGLFPPAFRGTDGAVAVYFEAAAVITVARAARPGARAARARTDRRRDPRPARSCAEDRAPHPRRRRGRGSRRSKRSRSAIACACGPGEKVPVDGEIDRRPQRGRRVHGDRRVDAGREEPPATRSSAARSTAAGSFVMRADKVGRDTMLAQIVQMVARGAAQPRADPAPGRSGVRLVRAAGDRGRGRSPSSPGRSGDPSRASPTRWSRRSRC